MVFESFPFFAGRLTTVAADEALDVGRRSHPEVLGNPAVRCQVRFPEIASEVDLPPFAFAAGWKVLRWALDPFKPAMDERKFPRLIK